MAEHSDHQGDGLHKVIQSITEAGGGCDVLPVSPGNGEMVQAQGRDNQSGSNIKFCGAQQGERKVLPICPLAL